MTSIHVRLYHIIPLVVFCLLITLHYYEFYVSQFLDRVKRVKPTFAATSYHSIQEDHPYYPLYQLSTSQHAKETAVFFLFTQRHDNLLDYTSTYYKHGEKQYLTEIRLMVEYFFYPRKIPLLDKAQLKKTDLKRGTIIISDAKLTENEMKEKQLKLAAAYQDGFNAIDLTERDHYLMYVVEK